MATDKTLASTLGTNIRLLRNARGLTQAQVARLAEVPRATWSNLESGDANPTLGVLAAVARVLQVSLEELLAPPKSSARLYPHNSLPVRRQGNVTARTLLPDPLPGVLMERLELPAASRLTGTPHTPGTREYLTCESGSITLHASGEAFVLRPGDVLVFRGDQRHSYVNASERVAVGYSVVLLKPPV